MLERGAGRVTVGAIASSARVARKSFYEHFSDCDDCLAAALDRAAAAAGEYARPAYESAQGWQDAIRGGLFALLVFFHQHPELAQLCVLEAPAGGQALRASRARTMDALAELIERGREDTPPSAIPQAAHGVLGAVSWLAQRHLAGPRKTEPLTTMLGTLMAFIVLPYRGADAAAEELAREPPPPPARAPRAPRPLEGLEIRMTYRTMRVLAALADAPGSSNKQIAHAAGITDPGQISKLLARIERAGLAINEGDGHELGARNEWWLTARGHELNTTLTRLGVEAT